MTEVNSTEEKLLPKPEPDLPKPELEIPPHVEAKRRLPLPKYFFLGVVFIILLVLIGGVYFLGKNQNNQQAPQIPTTTQSPTPTPDLTGDWETYEENGYSFKYPSSANALPEYGNDFDLKLSNGDLIHVITQENSENLSAREWLIAEFSVSEAAKFNDIKVTGLDSVQKNDYSVTHINTGNGEILTITFVKCDGPGCGAGIDIKTFNQVLSTFKFTDSSSSQNKAYLEIPEYRVKIPLTQNIADAYYLSDTASKSYVYLKVHSLDSEPYCNDKSSLGVAALNRVPKDEIDQRTGKKFSDSGTGSIIENYYYYIELSQAVCSQNTANQTIEANARKAFSESSIKSL